MKSWTEINKSEADSIVKWMEDPVATRLVIPLLAMEQELASRAALTLLRDGKTHEAAHLGGVVEGLTQLVAIHDRALEIAQEHDANDENVVEHKNVEK